MKLTCQEVRDLAAGYVLDALEPDEREAVREHLRGCNQPHDEYAEMGGVVPYLAEAIEPVEPPASLKQRILAAAAADSDAAATIERPASPPQPWTIPTSGARPVIPQRYRPAPLVWAGGIAAVLVIAVLGAATWLLQSELQAARQYEAGVASVLELAATEGSQVAILSGEEPTGPEGLAAIGADGRIAVAMRDLAPTAGNEVYEAWVIAGDAAPVPMGGFRVDENGTGTLVTDGPAPPAGVVVAITREPAPGATSPTGPIVVSGTAVAPSS